MNQNTLTKAPITPKEVRRKYSKGLCLETVFKNGYKYNGIWAKSKKRKRHILKILETETSLDSLFTSLDLVSACEATHCNKAKALQTRLLA